MQREMGGVLFAISVGNGCSIAGNLCTRTATGRREGAFPLSRNKRHYNNTLRYTTEISWNTPKKSFAKPPHSTKGMRGCI